LLNSKLNGRQLEFNTPLSLIKENEPDVCITFTFIFTRSQYFNRKQVYMIHYCVNCFKRILETVHCLPHKIYEWGRLETKPSFTT